MYRSGDTTQARNFGRLMFRLRLLLRVIRNALSGALAKFRRYSESRGPCLRLVAGSGGSLKRLRQCAGQRSFP